MAVSYVTLYLPDGTPVQVVEGGPLHKLYVARGADGAPPTPGPVVRLDPFPQYVDQDELTQALGGVGASDTAVAALVNDTGSQTRGALGAALVPQWKPSLTVTAGQFCLSPSGSIIQRNANGTTRSSYDATEQGLWTVVSGGGGAAVPNTWAPTLTNSSDDAPAIQAAIDAATAAGGGLVRLTGPAKINTTLLLKSGVTLAGLGSATVLSGTASPIIAVGSGAVDDIAVLDLTINNAPGDGLHLEVTGAQYPRLGWPRATVENVTVIDVGGRGVYVYGNFIEVRLVNVVAMRCGGVGIDIDTTDVLLWGCTAAQGDTEGIRIAGANSKISVCKSYGNTGDGFTVIGAGRHMLSSCEAQDNTLNGFVVSGDWNTLASCLADTNGQAGFHVYGSNNVLSACAAMHGGGGSGQVTTTGFHLTGDRLIVSGVTNSPEAYSSTGVDCTIDVKSQPSPPAKITDLSAGTISDTSVTLSWTAPPSGSPITDYALRYRINGAPTWTTSTLGSTATSHSVTGLAAGNAYDFQIAAVNSNGTAPWSDAVTATTTGGATGAFSDTFNRADGPLGNGWINSGDTNPPMTIVSNRADKAESNFHLSIATRAVSSANGTLVATKGQYSKLIFRYVDDDNYLYFQGDNIRKRAAGVETSIGGENQSGAFPDGSATVTVTLSGQSITVAAGGHTWTASDTFNQNVAVMGIATENGGDWVDDFSFTPA